MWWLRRDDGANARVGALRKLLHTKNTRRASDTAIPALASRLLVNEHTLRILMMVLAVG